MARASAVRSPRAAGARCSRVSSDVAIAADACGSRAAAMRSWRGVCMSNGKLHARPRPLHELAHIARTTRWRASCCAWWSRSPFEATVTAARQMEGARRGAGVRALDLECEQAL